MGDFNLVDYSTTPKIRKDWWEYWFTNDSFPYELGWHPPTAPRGKDFVLSASSRVLAAQVIATPHPLVKGAIGSNDPPGTLIEAGATTSYALPTFKPYAAKGVGQNDKRDVTDAAAMATATATAIAVPLKNPYVELLEPNDISNQQAYAHNRMNVLDPSDD